MSEPQGSRYMKVLTVSGAFLILLPVGVSWYWGNIAVYILSYILYCTNVNHWLEAPWILSFMRATWTLGLFCAGYITNMTGKRHATVVMGIFIFNSGIFLTYFATKLSVVLTSVCMGGLVGFGKGLIEGTTLNFVTDWAIKDAWFLKSFVLCAIPTGAIIISQFSTLHVNPYNLSPDLKAGHMMFFSQKYVLENVPSMFVKLGIASLVVQVIGVFLLRETDRGHHEENDRSANYGAVATDMSNSNNTDDHKNNSSSFNTTVNNGYEKFEDKKDETTQVTSFTGNNVVSKPTENASLSKSESTDQSPASVHDYKTPDLLQSCAFYAITVAYLCGDTSFIVFKNYYKSYGQQSIKNDHFLAEAVIVLCLIAIFVKIIWIFIMDGIGHITCMICQFSLMTVLTIFVYLSPLLNEWLYLFFYAVFNAVACSYDEVFTAISFRQFGKNIINTNFGLVTAITMGVHIATAPILQALLNDYGWFSIFAYSASLNFLGMLLLTAFYLKTSECWTYKSNPQGSDSK